MKDFRFGLRNICKLCLVIEKIRIRRLRREKVLFRYDSLTSVLRVDFFLLKTLVNYICNHRNIS